MKKIFLALVILALWVTPALAGDLYVSGSVGAVFGDYDSKAGDEYPAGVTDHEFDEDAGRALVAAIGKRFGSIRTELEYAYRNQNIDSMEISSGSAAADLVIDGGEVSIHSLMANLYTDIGGSSKFAPYVGGGLGIAWNKLKNDGVAGLPLDSSNTNTALGYQVMAGVGVPFTKAIAGKVGYRLFGTTDDYLSHGIEVGINYNF